MRGKRRLSAYLIEPFQQIRFGLYVVGVCSAFAAVFSWTFVHAFREQYSQVLDFFKVVDESNASALISNDVFNKNMWLMSGIVVVFVVTVIAVVVRRTHRMYGPMISIMRFVNELSAGNYNARIHIRQKDDFQDLVRYLNRLAVALHTRHGAHVGEDASLATSGMDNLENRISAYEDGVVHVDSPDKDIDKVS